MNTIPHSWQKWTPEQDAILGEIWAGKLPLRRSLHRLDGHSYHGAQKRGVKLFGRRDIKGLELPQACWSSLQVVLRDGPLSISDLSTKSGVSPRNVLKLLRERHGTQVHITSWEKHGPGSPASIWALGNEQDAARPKAMNSKQRWNALKNDPERYIRMTARKRSYSQSKAAPKRDESVIALFGRVA